MKVAERDGRVRAMGAPGRVVIPVVLGVAASALSGCVSYRAAIEKDVQRGDLDVRIDHAAAHPRKFARVTMVITRVPPEVRLMRASLSTDPYAVCAGARGTRLARDDNREPEAPLVSGEHLTIEFEPSVIETLSQSDAHLDLLLKTQQGKYRCVPFLLSRGNEPLTWEPNERFTIGFDLSIEGYTSLLGPVQQIITFPLELGVWAGRVHLDVAAGIAGAGCPDTQCAAPDANQKINYSNAWPIQAGARIPLYETGEWSFGAGLHYRAIALAADTFTGRQTFWVHGPVFAPYVGVAGRVVQNVNGMGGARVGLCALELPIGYAVAGNGTSSLSLGVNLALLFTAF